jgi:hypothetical protein
MSARTERPPIISLIVSGSYHVLYSYNLSRSLSPLGFGCDDASRILSSFLYYAVTLVHRAYAAPMPVCLC